MSKKKNKKKHNSLRESRNEVFKSNANGAPVSAPAPTALTKIVIACKDDIPDNLPDNVSAELRRWIGAKAGASAGANKGSKPSQPLEFESVKDIIKQCVERIQKRAEKRAEAAELGKPRRGPGRPRKSDQEATATETPKRKRTTTKKAEASETKPETATDNEREKALMKLNISLSDVARLFEIDADNLTAFVQGERLKEIARIQQEIKRMTDRIETLKKKSA